MSERTKGRAEAIGTEVGRYSAAFTKPVIWGLLVGGTGVPVLPLGSVVPAAVAVVVLLGLLTPPRGSRLLDLPAASKARRVSLATVTVLVAHAFGVGPNAFMAGAVLHLAFKALALRPTNLVAALGSVACLLAGGWLVVDGGVLLTSGGDLSIGAAVRDGLRFLALALLVGAAASDERKEAELEAARDGAVRDERARIARELHDVVAHHVSAMTIQAEAARSALPAGAGSADAALSRAATEGRTAMTELRTLLGVLRAPAGEAELGPQPTLDDLDELVAELRRGGLDVRFDRSVDDDAGLSPAVRLSAYRIAQEALANVRRHAGDTVVRVRVRTEGPAMILEVADDGRGTASFRARSAGAAPGYGILGMQERAALIGGTVEAAPRTDGPGWRVRAVLPLQPVSA